MVLRVDERDNWAGAYFSRAFFVGAHRPSPNRRTRSQTPKPSPSLRILVSLIHCAYRLFFQTARNVEEDRFDSYSDESSMWYEILRYRMTGNGAHSAACHIIFFPPPLN